MAAVPPDTVLLLLGSGTALGALPLWLGWVRPNRIYGIRVAAAFVSEANWYAINRYGAGRFMVFGVIVALSGAVLGQFPQAPFWLPIAALFATVGLLLRTIAAINRFAAALQGSNG